MAMVQREMDGSMMLIPDEDEGGEHFGSGDSAHEDHHVSGEVEIAGTSGVHPTGPQLNMNTTDYCESDPLQM